MHTPDEEERKREEVVVAIETLKKRGIREGEEIRVQQCVCDENE